MSLTRDFKDLASRPARAGARLLEAASDAVSSLDLPVWVRRRAQWRRYLELKMRHERCLARLRRHCPQLLAFKQVSAACELIVRKQRAVSDAYYGECGIAFFAGQLVEFCGGLPEGPCEAKYLWAGGYMGGIGPMLRLLDELDGTLGRLDAELEALPGKLSSFGDAYRAAGLAPLGAYYESLPRMLRSRLEEGNTLPDSLLRVLEHRVAGNERALNRAVAEAGRQISLRRMENEGLLEDLRFTLRKPWVQGLAQPGSMQTGEYLNALRDYARDVERNLLDKYGRTDGEE